MRIRVISTGVTISIQTSNAMIRNGRRIRSTRSLNSILSMARNRSPQTATASSGLSAAARSGSSNPRNTPPAIACGA
jgi:hypothetical protein